MVNGTLTQTVGKNYSITALEKFALQITSDISINSIDGNYALKVGKKTLLDSIGNYEINVGGETMFDSIGNYSVVAPRIDLN
jgi:hypothetical protein